MSLQTWQETLMSSTAPGALFNAFTTAKSVSPYGTVVTLPPNWWYPGRTVRMTAMCGISNNTSAQTMNFSVNMGAVAAATSGNFNLTTTAHTTIPSYLTCVAQCVTIGTSTNASLRCWWKAEGPMFAQAASLADNAAGTGQAFLAATANGTGFDSTASLTMDFFAGISTNTTSVGIQVNILTWEIIEPKMAMGRPSGRGGAVSGRGGSQAPPKYAYSNKLAAPLGAAVNADLAVTEANDTISAIATLLISGTTAVTEANDTISAAATLPIVATLTATEANDTISGAATLALTGTLAVTEATDTISAAATLLIQGTLAVTEAADTLSADATMTQAGIVGNLAVTEADDTISGAATLALGGTLAVTEAADTISATSTLSLGATLAVTEAADTVAGAATLAIVGTLAVTEDADTLSADAHMEQAAGPVNGDLNVTEDNDGISASATMTSATGAFGVPAGGSAKHARRRHFDLRSSEPEPIYEVDKGYVLGQQGLDDLSRERRQRRLAALKAAEAVEAKAAELAAAEEEEAIMLLLAA